MPRVPRRGVHRIVRVPGHDVAVIRMGRQTPRRPSPTKNCLTWSVKVVCVNEPQNHNPQNADAAPRVDGRSLDQLREVTIKRNWLCQAEGSVLVSFGRTTVLCNASVTEGVPRWRKGSGLGWVTAEYEMLPRATNERSARESRKGKVGGRTHEISRLVGRSLRAVVDDKALGENTIILDCDVLQADGGTRTASITGAYVALVDAVNWLRERGSLAGEPITGSVQAISVGVVGGTPMLDLAYEEDSRADTDMNVVMSGTGDFVEIQGTAEGAPFNRGLLNELLDLAAGGCASLKAAQSEALGVSL